MILLTLGVIFIGGHVWILNDLYGRSADVHNPAKNSPLLSAEVSPKGLFVLSFILLFLGLCTCFLFTLRTFIIALLIGLILDLYSCEPFFLKGKPILSSLVHLVGGTLFFLSGYSIFRRIDMGSVLIGFYFGIVFTAGHLNHEVKDYEGDLVAGIMTNAVRFGKKKMFFLSFFLFSLSSIYFYFLGFYGIVYQYLSVMLLAIYPFYIYFFCDTLRKGLSCTNMYGFRKRYRTLYGIMGCFMGIFIVINLF
ncbi:MAG: UbiA family prenyltransferase [Candidatus Omnitrophica bacterium]|nr:UbiA family prenyltransferase [Candidatus Omnitrophota bacterium]